MVIFNTRGNFCGVEICLFCGHPDNLENKHWLRSTKFLPCVKATLQYVCPISFDDKLSCSVLTTTIKEVVNCRVLEVQKNGKKHGQYSKFSDKQKYSEESLQDTSLRQLLGMKLCHPFSKTKNKWLKSNYANYMLIWTEPSEM